MATAVTFPSIGGVSYSVPALGEVNWQSLSNYLIALATAQGTTSQKVAIRKCTTTPVTVISSSDCVLNVQLAAPGAVSVVLPVSPQGQYYTVIDGTGDASTNNVTITASGGATINGSASYVISTDRGSANLIYILAANNWIAQSSGTIGTLPISNGGTGQTTANAALNALLPSQTSNSGKVLSTDGSNASWASILTTVLPSAEIFVGNGSNVATAVAVSGDATLANTGALTLATVNGNVGAFGSATSVAGFTVNAKGLITAAASTAIQLGSSAAVTGLDAQLALLAPLASPTFTGTVVLPSGQVLIAPALGTPASGTMTNVTGLPLTTGVTGTLPVTNGGTGITSFGTGVASALGANVSGSGSIAMTDSPGFVTPALGTPASGVMTNVTGLPLTTAVTGTLPVANGGTGVTSSSGASSVMLRDANQNVAVNNALEGYATTATAAGTTTLTVASAYQQYFTGSTTQTVTLPVTSTLTLGHNFQIVNLSTGVVTVNSSGGNLVATVSASSSLSITCILTSGTTAASWSAVASSSASGSGLGGINYVTNPNDANAGWAVTNTAGSNPMAVATTTTTGDLPLGNQVSTAIKITSRTAVGTEANEYVSFPFTTPASGGVKTPITFWMRPGSNFIASEWTVSIYQSTTRQSLSTDTTGPATYLPNATGYFQTTCDLLASTAYTLRFARPVNAGGNAGVLNLAGVFCGLQSITQGAAVGLFRTYTPVAGTDILGSTSNPAFGTVVNNQVTIWRNGSNATIRWDYYHSAAGSLGSGRYQFKMPSGLTIDTSLVTAQSVASGLGNGAVGTFTATDNTNEAIYSAQVASSTLIEFRGGAGIGAWASSDVITFADTLLRVSFIVTVPIAEWAGNGTVNLGAGAQVEYAYNTSSATTGDDSTSFGYGPTGAQIVNITAAGKRRVRFQYPIQDGDILEVQVKKSATAPWVVLDHWDPSTGLQPYQVQSGGAAYGLGIDYTAVNSTDVDVLFGTYCYASGATLGAAGSAWSGANAFKWRVRKVSASSPVGFGLAGTDGSSGLYKAGQAPGLMTGAAISAGYVGEKITWTSAPSTQATSTSIADWTNAFITLTPGVWRVEAVVSATYTTGTSNNDQGTVIVSITDSSNAIVQEQQRRIYVKNSGTIANTAQGCLTFSFIVNTTSSPVYKIRIIHGNGVGTGSGSVSNASEERSHFYAVRIA